MGAHPRVRPRPLRPAPPRRLLVLLATLAASLVPLALAAPAASAASLPPVGHVWVIMFENHSVQENFGVAAQNFKPRPGVPESMTYMASTLPSLGARLDNYFGVAHPSQSNYTALLSGQPPSMGYFSRTGCPKTGVALIHLTFCTGTLLDCFYYKQFRLQRLTKDGVAIGQGCVYPRRVMDIGTQLRQRSRVAKIYSEDMPRPCTHAKLGTYDTRNAGLNPGYEPGGNPFVYFHNWIDKPTACAAASVPLNRNTLQPLLSDLSSVSTTPAFSWIAPNLCDQGHNYCPNYYSSRATNKFFAGTKVCPGPQPASEYCDAQSSHFLNLVVPKIMASPAYKKDGLIAIVWDEANFYPSSPYVDSRACCAERQLPGATGLADIAGEVKIPLIGTIKVTNGTNRLLIGGPDDSLPLLVGLIRYIFHHPRHAFSWRPGGGDSGAVLLSPFIKPGTVSKNPYSHYGLLRTFQKLLGLPLTANAADPRVHAIGSDVFNNVPPR